MWVMEDYLEASVLVIILFIAGLISAIIVYLVMRIISGIITRNNPSENEQSLLDFIAWLLAFLTWGIVDYYLYQYLKSSFYW